jgi:hypothetical protein
VEDSHPATLIKDCVASLQISAAFRGAQRIKWTIGALSYVYARYLALRVASVISSTACSSGILLLNIALISVHR